MKMRCLCFVGSLALAGFFGCGDDEPGGGDTDAEVRDAANDRAIGSDGSANQDGAKGDASQMSADGAVQDGAATSDATLEDGALGDGTVPDSSIADASLVDGALVSCMGTPTACGTFTDSASCQAQMGCGGGGTCSGGTRRCATYSSAKACVSGGCNWATPCTKSGAACDTYTVKADCLGDPQCAIVDAKCVQDPTVTACRARFVKTQCSARAGCTWSDDDFTCRGTAATCESQSALDCDSQDGCALQ